MVRKQKIYTTLLKGTYSEQKIGGNTENKHKNKNGVRRKFKEEKDLVKTGVKVAQEPNY